MKRSGLGQAPEMVLPVGLLLPLMRFGPVRDLLFRAKHLFVAAMVAGCAQHPPPKALAIHYLFSRRHSSIASRIASKRPHFFRAIHRSIRASFPSFMVVMKTLLNSCMIHGSTLWAFRGRNNKISASSEACYSDPFVLFRPGGEPLADSQRMDSVIPSR